MVGPAYRTADATVAAYEAVGVTPLDAGNLNPTRSLFIGTGGNLRVTMAYGTDITFTNVQPGSILPIQAVRVWATGTTASGIIALY